MNLDAIPADQLDDLVEDLADLRHDLGKYVTFEVRFVGLDAETEALRAALTADIRHTYKRGAQVEAAWQVWARLRPPALDAADPDVATIERALDALQQIPLSSVERSGLERAAGLAAEIAAACRALARRARERNAAEGGDV